MSIVTHMHLDTSKEVEFVADKLLRSGTQELMCYTLDLKSEDGQVSAFMTLEQMMELTEALNNFIHPIKMPTTAKVEGGKCAQLCVRRQADLCCNDCDIRINCPYDCEQDKKDCRHCIK